jgi:hypothetical protein
MAISNELSEIAAAISGKQKTPQFAQAQRRPT